MITDKIGKERVHGYLHVQDGRLVNGRGEEILLTGWGLGNWLLPEGYMWLAAFSEMDRPARIEKIVRELTDKDYAEYFWREFRKNYIRREDILEVAHQGYNSVRIPFNWRLFMEDEEEIVWKDEGFAILDHCLEWCEEAGIYAFLDLHGAPGGQTGSNIDDSKDNRPDLFLNLSYREKALALWKKLAMRYKNREIVGGYDLLNEPIIPPGVGNGDFDYLLPELERFYEDCVHIIREEDKKHLISIEGHHWATKTDIFHKKYDDNMVLHFHRYATMPDIDCFKPYLDAAEAIGVPLWLGETGENKNTWYAAMYPLSLSLGIGYNLWPWKKMKCTNSPFSVKEPEGWQEILRFAKKGEGLSKERAKAILNQYLENILLENCDRNDEVTRHVFRTAPCELRATDFEENVDGQPGHSKIRPGTENAPYRKNCGMQLVELFEKKDEEFVFDCGWDRFGLQLDAGEYVCYRFFCLKGETKLYLTAKVAEPALIRISQDGEELGRAKLKTETKEQSYLLGSLEKNTEAVIRLEILEGSVCAIKLNLE